MGQKVAILGASTKPERYAYKAFKMLQEYGHTPIPVAPALEEVEGIRAYARLSEVPGPVDTLTMYIGPQRSSPLADEIVKFKPGRVIFNPGSENPELKRRLQAAGIPFEEACTLVLLRTHQF
jgi:predicted CoA-binding protein